MKHLVGKPPKYGHMTLILNENRKKLSKRDKHIIQFIEQYKNLGYLPEAMFNFITLLAGHLLEKKRSFERNVD